MGKKKRKKKNKKNKKKDFDMRYMEFVLKGWLCNNKFMAGYIHINEKRKFKYTKEIFPEVVVDFDKKDRPIGVEILNLKSLDKALQWIWEHSK